MYCLLILLLYIELHPVTGWLLFRLGHSAAVGISSISLCYSGLEVYTGLELMRRYAPKSGGRFVLVKDEVADIPYMCLAIMITYFGLF